MASNIGTKRLNTDDDGGSPTKKIKVHCVFGEKCYRRNPTHFEEYSHPHLGKLFSDGKVLTNGKDLKLPSDFKPRIDADTLLTQLEIYREHDFAIAKKPENKITQSKNSNDTNLEHKTKIVEKEIIKDTKSLYSQRNKDDKIIKDTETEKKESSLEGTNILSLSSPSSSSSIIILKRNYKEKQKPSKRLGFAHKLKAAAPYNFFVTAICDSPATHREPLGISFHELLDPTLGDLESSLQINYMVELDWLMEQYKAFGHEKKPLFILYGVEDDMLENPKTLPSNIKVKKIKPGAFGHHHTKMSFFYYKDNSLRVVVSTANLISSDWYNRTQGVWVSPSCPELPPGSDTKAGESVSEFKADILRYMSFYQLPALQEWMSRLRKADFSAVKVCFVASVPGSHRGPDSEKWGHRRLGHLLKKHATIPSLLSPTANKENWPIIAQCSSIGSLGSEPNTWMCGELRNSMSQKSLQPGDMPQPPPNFKIIYPSLQNVKDSHDGKLGGACLPYSKRTHEKQQWFRKFLYEWKSDKRHRSQAMPHIKSYARVSPCGHYLSWFHLTSANLSKAAWGKIQDTKGKSVITGLYIMSYEAGVLFLPKLLMNEEVFHLNEEAIGSENKNPFPLPWDLPLLAYSEDDKPWVYEYMQ